METSLYIHVPFCKRKCSYCDFYSLADRQAEDLELYKNILCLELRQEAERHGHPEVRSIFFGGGTPTLLTGKQIREIMRVIRAEYALSCDCEITMEGNPGTLTEEKLCVMREAGINRLSIGVQSFSDSLLREIGRIHSAADARDAVRMAREAGFRNLNLDLMYGLPGQTMRQWEETVREAIMLSPEHLSCYSLIVEPGTPLADCIDAGTTPVLPDEDTLVQMETFLRNVLTDAGFERYEVSNYAKSGFACRHNLVYWECLPYLGFGPAAHSDYGGRRFFHPDDLDLWIRSVQGNDKPCQSERAAAGTYILENNGSRSERQYERMMMGLRMTRGVDLDRFYHDFGCMPENVWPDTMEKMKAFGMLVVGEGRMHLTEKGMDVMNYWLVQMMEEEERHLSQ